MERSLAVILVPGIFDNEQRMRGLAGFLQKAGWQTRVIAPQPSDGSRGLEVMAWEVARHIAAEFPAS